LSIDVKIVLYAPTFRENRSIQPYKLNWNIILESFKNLFKDDNVIVLLRLHPGMIGTFVFDLLDENFMKDVTNYPDMQELLSVSDVLITDYSSTMFDFALLGKKCFIYASDYDKYDRGFYFSIKKLPFPFASTQKELIYNVDNFDIKSYKKGIDKFFNDYIGPIYDNGCASKEVYYWMLKHSM
jgi:CDP-glycerol glycerophosphotransferase